MYVGLVDVLVDAVMLLGIVVEEGSKSICPEGGLSERQLLICDCVFLGAVVCMVFTEKNSVKSVRRERS